MVAPHRQANIATPTGAPGFDVLDVDVRNSGAGWDAFERAKRAGLLDGWTRAVRTPSGGLHLSFPGTEQRSGSLPDHHLDFRGRGGYVLLPPSLGQTKDYSRRYVLLEARSGPGRPVDWSAVVTLLRPPTSSTGSRVTASRSTSDPIPILAAYVARQREGGRNSALYWATHRALDADTVDLEPLVSAGVRAGLPEAEARRTVDSARRCRQRTGGPAIDVGPPPACSASPYRSPDPERVR